MDTNERSLDWENKKGGRYGKLAHAVTQVNGIRMHYVIQGSGPQLMLLHSWPQTWYEWWAYS